MVNWRFLFFVFFFAVVIYIEVEEEERKCVCILFFSKIGIFVLFNYKFDNWTEDVILC